MVQKRRLVGDRRPLRSGSCHGVVFCERFPFMFSANQRMKLITLSGIILLWGESVYLRDEVERPILFPTVNASGTLGQAVPARECEGVKRK